MLHQAHSGFAVLEAVIWSPNNWRSGFGAILLMHNGFEVALKQPEQAHTGFEVALERQHCQFEPAVIAT